MITGPYGLIIAGCSLVIALGVGYTWGRLDGGNACKADQLELTQQARTREHELQTQHQKATDAKDAELRALSAAHDALMRELRNRPKRLPDAARAACAGSAGSELSGPDAEFLAGLAARADELRTHLAACQERERVNWEAMTR